MKNENARGAADTTTKTTRIDGRWAVAAVEAGGFIDAAFVAFASTKRI